MSQRIDRLLHEAHRSKELIPAIEEELRRLREGVGGGADRRITEDLDAAIREISELRDHMGLEAQRSRIKAHSFPSTGLGILDSQLISEQGRALEKGLHFEIIVLDPVTELLREEVIHQFDLQVLIGDLYRNAAAATEHSGIREILLSMGHTERGYQIRVSDSGAYFPEEVLRNLGVRYTAGGRVHYGYTDVMDILYRSGASLRVEEHPPGERLFTKQITVTFDGLGKLRIITFRTDELNRIDDIGRIIEESKEREKRV